MDLAGIPYAGTRMRICTSSPKTWWVEERTEKGWFPAMHWNEVHSIGHWHRTFYTTEAECVAYIDEEVRCWKIAKREKLIAEAYALANPPREYP